MERYINHQNLIKFASEWLRKKCVVVITEMAHCTEEPDAIGFKSWGESILIECKASRNDFLGDSKKSYRHYPQEGMGKHRYFITPKGLVKPEKLPENWGLIEVNTDTLKTRVSVQPQPFLKRNIRRETTLLISALRRIGQISPKGLSIKYYTYEIEKPRATLGVAQMRLEI